MRLSNIILAEGVKAHLSTLTYDQVAKALGDSRFSAPYASDALRQINGEDSWEDWKQHTIEKWGNVEIELNPTAPWFGKVKVLDPKFIKSKEASISGKAAWLDKEREAGRKAGLD